MELDLSNRSAIEKEINGALSTAIFAHGPVTLENRPSASKRIYSALAARARREYLEAKKDEADG